MLTLLSTLRQASFLAVQALKWYRGRSAIIVMCLAIMLGLPVTMRFMLEDFRHEITARAEATPLLIGAAGSRIDLALHSMYFDGPAPARTTMQEVDSVQKSGFATAIPVYQRYRTQSRNGNHGAAIVGTTPEYFEFRDLTIARGQPLAFLGDCVVGSRAAIRLNLHPGDSVLSAPQNAFDLAADYPLKMNVAGVLAPTHSPDDDAVFVDVRTVWVIDGIGHGHQSLNQQSDEDLLLKKNRSSVTASAAVLPYTEITEDNIDSFHFHGEPSEFPVSSVIVEPHSERDRLLLMGRYQAADSSVQMIQPPAVVAELLNMVFRVEQFVRFSSLIAVFVTMILLGLVLFLSLRLRQPEMDTLFRLGGSRSMIAAIVSTELALMLILSAALAVSIAMLCRNQLAGLIRQMLF
ncbi:MAG: ABC transporter permease [Planctomycetaceae bacterium]|nr:ABC transporter permease [Planctomycetaceae bacterium]